MASIKRFPKGDDIQPSEPDRKPSASKRSRRPADQEQNARLVMVKHPPTGVWDTNELLRIPPPYVSEAWGNLDVLVAIELELHEQQYEATGNPLELISAFRLAHESKLYPPMWVLHGLAASFKSYERADGRESLDDLLGFKRGKRKDSWFAAKERRNLHLCLATQMFYLKCLFDISTLDAARMVAAKRKATLNGMNVDRRLNHTPYTVNTLVQHYSRRWKKEFGFDAINIDGPLHPEKIKRWSDDDLRQFMAAFPPRSIPRSIRQRLSLPSPISRR